MEIEQKVMRIIADHLDIKPEQLFSDDDLINDLGADSLDVVEMQMLLEQEFKVQISDEDAARINKVEDVVSFIRERVSI